ncbi:MAG: selenocysteine-specific translation elongation factor [Desulfobulbus sp.]|jgi:selenocysteine-specific elongation factor
MRAIILGTAGHVDHGKTSLIRALTGIETDRLDEEKKRGITIDLGFAWLDLPCGHRLGIVDVPGHEKFVRNMVAGAAGMDLVAFVIAADEGIMPQTIEHFQICRLLGVRDGLIILTKKDTVDSEWLEMVQEEVRAFFTGSFLEDAPIIAVDSISGDGIDEVVRQLDAKVRALDFEEVFGAFRMAVDRVFTMKGFGTVITGTSLNGRLETGAELMLYPGGLVAKVRGIQVHGRPVEVVEPGHRTAINLQGVEKEEVRRGDVAATLGSMTPSTLLDARLELLPGLPLVLKNRAPVRVHLGTREIQGRVVLLETDTAEAGTTTHVQLVLREPAAVWPGDRYVLRGSSPITTIGGGVILDSTPKKRKRTLEKDRVANQSRFAVYDEADSEQQILLLVEECGFRGITADQLAARIGIFSKRLKKLLLHPLSTGALVMVDSENQHMLAASAAERLNTRILEILTRFHQEHPLKSGMPKEELHTRLRMPMGRKILHSLVNGLIRKGQVEQSGGEIRIAGHTVTLLFDEQAMAEEIAALYREAGLAPPNFKDVVARFDAVPADRIRQVVNLLLADGSLIKINETLFFDSQAVRALQEEVVAVIRAEGRIDAQRFKELTGLTRKFSIPLLEYFDKIKLTIRVEDHRVLRKS